MHRISLLLVALPLLGCSNIDDYFSTIVAEGLLLGIEELPAEFADVGLGASATATTFVAEARSLNDVESNLVDNADRVAIAQGDSVADLENLGSGLYETDSSLDADLVYVVGGSYRLQVERSGDAHYVDIVAPAPPDLVGVPGPADLHPANTTITVDLTGQGYNNYLALVAQVDVNGDYELTYTTIPETAGDYIDWIRDRNEVTTVEIPGSAFPSAGSAYIVAVAGVAKAKDADFESLNPLVSNFAAGSASPAAVTTAP